MIFNWEATHLDNFTYGELMEYPLTDLTYLAN